MLTDGQRESILYQAQVVLGDLAYEIAQAERVGTPCEELYERAYFITAYMQALQVNTCALSETEKDQIYEALRNLTQKYNYPIAPSIANPVTFPSIILSPVACCGAGTGGGGGPGVPVPQKYINMKTLRQEILTFLTSLPLPFVL